MTMRLKLTIAALLVAALPCMGQKPHDEYAPKPSPVPCQDTTKVLCIGNSFTYFFDSPHKLQEIAAFEGHWLDIHVSTKGGYTFANHIVYAPTAEAIGEGGYDVAFLQDQSQAGARFKALRSEYPYIRKDFETLSDCVRTWSRDCRIILERTWSYPAMENGGFPTEAEFDEALAKGTRKVAKRSGAGVSPIGDAFTICRKMYPEINLLHIDGHHQSPKGTYLKACVNYLMLFGQKFGPSPSNCDIDPDTAAKLRGVAEHVVLHTKIEN